MVSSCGTWRQKSKILRFVNLGAVMYYLAEKLQPNKIGELPVECQNTSPHVYRALSYYVQFSRVYEPNISNTFKLFVYETLTLVHHNSYSRITISDRT